MRLTKFYNISDANDAQRKPLPTEIPMKKNRKQMESHEISPDISLEAENMLNPPRVSKNAAVHIA